MTGVLLREKDRQTDTHAYIYTYMRAHTHTHTHTEETEGETSQENGDGEENYVARSQRLLATMKKLGEKQKTDFPLEPLEGTSSADTLISYFWNPEQ